MTRLEVLLELTTKARLGTASRGEFEEIAISLGEALWHLSQTVRLDVEAQDAARRWLMEPAAVKSVTKGP